MCLLRPSPEVNQIIEFCLGLAAARTGVEIHAFCAMSNHVHTVATDAEGRLPEFLHLFHRHVAVALNRLHGRQENLWSGQQTSVVELGDEQDVLDKLAYVVANPTSAGLVRTPKEWPGVISRQLGKTKCVERPSSYFRAKGTVPERVDLTFTVPPQLSHHGNTKANELFFAALAHKLTAACADVLAKGCDFLGAKAVMKISLTRVALSKERTGTKSPRFAIRQHELYAAALARLKGFLLAYREAFDGWRMGNRSVRFPEGTWLMKRAHGVKCGPPHPVAS